MICGGNCKKCGCYFKCWGEENIMKLKTIDNLKLSKKNKIKVKTWLEEWLNHFISIANGQQGNVRRVDFENMDFFFFTDCRDLKPESKGNENQLEIRRRKRAVLFQLLFKHMLGKKTYTPVPCSHCGYKEIYFGGLPDGSGHYDYCPKCGKTNLCTYPNFYDTSMELMKSEIKRKNLNALYME